MKTVKAARIHQYGGAEVVRLEEIELPDPKQDELIVRVHAAGVNPIDWKLRAGRMQKMMSLPLPFTLGGDFSGVVEETGAQVTAFRTGDEVYGQGGAMRGGSGSFAERLVVKSGTIAAKPRRSAHLEAAALPLVGVSALQALTEHLRVTKGQKVLIHGGAGGIGSTAIQIARHLGAQVATTVAGDDAEFAKSLGAEQVIDYRNQRFDEILHDLDGVLDTIGGDTYARSFQVLRKGGRLVSMLEQPREDLMRDYGVEAIAQFTQVTTERLARLAELVDQGAVKVHVDRTFPLQQAAEALQSLEKTPPRGKIVIKIA
jgi:NADPH:quinone reductase-like Zn-dependent oxidoreductase